MGIFNPEKFRIDPPKFQIHKNLRHLLCLPQSERFSPEVLEIQAILELKFSRFKCQWIAWPKQVRNNLCRILSYQQVEKGKTIIKYGHIAYNYYLVFSGSVRCNIPIIKSAGGGGSGASDDSNNNKTDKFSSFDEVEEISHLLRQPHTGTKSRRELENMGHLEWKTIAELLPGQGFGELGLMGDGLTRNADVIANTDCELLVLSRVSIKKNIFKDVP